MKKQLENELIVALMPYMKDMSAQDLKIVITIVLSKYEIAKAETALTVYEGDVNETILKRFLAAKIAAGCSTRTIQFYRISIQKVLDKINKPYTDVTADDLRMFFASRIHFDKVSKVTANNEKRCVSSFYGWLQREEILLKNPMNKMDPIKETKKKKKAFEQMDLESIRYVCRSSRETAIIEVLISTWCRVSEIVNMRIDEIHGDKIVVHGKGDKEREVYLNAKAQLAIRKYLDDRKDNNPYLFPRARYAGDFSKMYSAIARKAWDWYKDPELVDDKGRPMDKSSFGSIVREIGKRAGVPNTHPHRFRRTGATHALHTGMSIVTVSKLLGHESIDTTQIYLDVSDEELEQAHKKFVV